MAMKLPEKGSLRETALPDILLDLYARRFTGRLELARGRSRKAFELQDGAPVRSESSVPSEGLAAILESTERLCA